MSPKEKAEQLIYKFTFASMYFTDGENGAKMMAKYCALLSVDEILHNFGLLHDGKKHYASSATIDFYEKVKQEIKNL